MKKTQKEIEALLDEEVKKVKEIIQSSESEFDALHYYIYNLVTFAPTDITHFEIIGLLEEVKLNWREESLKALEDENESEGEGNKDLELC